MTWRSVFLILTVCFFNLCHRCSALWVDTTHTISRHCCIVNSLADTCRSDDMKEGNFHFFSQKEGENYTPDFARCEVNNVLFMQRIEPGVRIHRSGRTGAGWLEVFRERRKRMRERVGGDSPTNCRRGKRITKQCRSEERRESLKPKQCETQRDQVQITCNFNQHPLEVSRD